MEITVGKIVSILTIVGFLVGAAYGIEDRFVNERENIQSMQQMQSYYDGKLDVVQYEFLQDKRIMLERQIRDNPSDYRAKEDLRNVMNKLSIIEQRMMTR